MESVEYLKIKIQQLKRQRKENQKYFNEEEIKDINHKIYDTNSKSEKTKLSMNVQMMNI